MKKSMQKFTWIGLILGILLYLSPAVLAWDYHYPSEETGVIYDRASHTYIVDNGQITGETIDGTLIYDPTTNVLTINSLSDSVDLQIKNMSDDFTINLAGDNNLSTRSSIISVNDDLTIEGNGSLIISNDSCYTYDIDSCQNSDCDYDDYEYFEDYRDYDDYDQDYGGMIDVAGNLTIKSSTIEIHALETAIYVEGTYSQTGGSVNLVSNRDNALSTQNTTINNGILIAETSGHNSAIHGQVTVADGLTIMTGNSEVSAIDASAYAGESYVSIGSTATDIIEEDADDEADDNTDSSDDSTTSGISAFLLKDINGNFYQYNAAAISQSFLIYQPTPESTQALMYKHFESIIGGGGKVVGVKYDLKGYMDYDALVTAFLMTQLSGSTFNTDSYLASDAAKLLSETITDVIIIGEDGAVTELPEINDYTTAFYTSLTPGAKIVTVTINVTNPSDSTVTYNGIELIYNETLNLFQAEVPVTTPETLTRKCLKR